MEKNEFETNFEMTKKIPALRDVIGFEGVEQKKRK